MLQTKAHRATRQTNAQPAPTPLALAAREAVAALPRAAADTAANDTPAPASAFDGLVAALTAPSSLPEQAAEMTAMVDEVDDPLEDAPADGEAAKAVELFRHRDLSRTLGTDRRRLIAARMLEAREINGYAQTEAAGLFGHRNPTQLSLWERGSRVPPLKDLIRAAELYGCSVDFMLGISAESDRDPRPARRAATVRAVQSLLQGVAERVVEQVDLINELAGPSAQTVRNLVLKATALADATDAFMRKNSRKFDDMPAGAPLAHAQQELEPLLAGAREMLRRLDRAERELDARLRGQLAAPLPEAPTDSPVGKGPRPGGGTAANINASQPTATNP